MSTLLSSEIVKAVPKSIKVDSKFDSGAVSRTTRSWAANNDTYSPNSVGMVSITIPAVGWVDFANSYITGWLDFSAGLELGRSIHSLFRRVTVRASNGQVLCDTDSYNVLSAMLQSATLSKEEQERSFSITSLMGDSTRRRKTGVSFAFQPLISILRSEKLIPLQYLGALTIELHLDDVRTAFKSYLGAPNEGFAYSISGVKYVCDVVTMDEEIESLTRNAYERGMLRWHFESWRFSPAQSKSKNYDLKIETLDNSVKALLVAIRSVSKLTSQSEDSFERTKGALSEVQFQVGSNLIDRFNARGGAAQLYLELEKVLEMTNNGIIDYTNWETKEFVLALNLTIINDPNFLSGYSSRGTITVRLLHGEPEATFPLPDDGLSYYSFVLHDIVVTASAQNGTSVLY